MRKYKKWARHSTCEPYLGEIIESPVPDWSELEQYRGQYVMIRDKHVVANASTVQEVYDTTPDGILMFVPLQDESWYFYAAS